MKCGGQDEMIISFFSFLVIYSTFKKYTQDNILEMFGQKVMMETGKKINDDGDYQYDQMNSLEKFMSKLIQEDQSFREFSLITNI